MKNHFIPCFYTKRWVGGDGKLIRFSRPNRNLIDRRKYPQQVGYKEDLYTLPGIEDETKNMLENDFFRDIDQRASDVLEKMESSSAVPQSRGERLSWVMFLISLRQRNPQGLARVARMADASFKKDIEDYRRRYNLLERQTRNQSFDEFIHSIRDDGWFERTNKLLIKGAIALPQTTEALIAFRWEIIECKPPDYELLISDRPVIMTNGLAHKEGHVALPIGPRKLFVAARDKAVMAELRNLKQISQAANKIVVGQAFEEVYSTDLTQARFVGVHFGKSPDEREA